MFTSKTIARRVDQSAIRVSQTFVAGLLILAFLVDALALVAFVALVMLAGAAFPRLALFQKFYHRALLPLGLVQPRIEFDNPEPHRFAQGLGGCVVALSALALSSGWLLLGWSLSWLVIALAGANVLLGFCTGCFIYYQLNRLGVPGFRFSPLRRR